MKTNYLDLLKSVEITGGDVNGFHSESDVRYNTSDGVPFSTLWTEFDRTLEIWNQHKTGLAALFTYPVVDEVEKVSSVGNVKFEKASEYGVAKAVKLNIDYYQLAYGWNDWDIATRFSWKFLRENNAAYLRTLHDKIMEAQELEIFTEVMKAIFDNRNRASEVNGLGYNVYPLYNGSGPKPPDYNGTVFQSTHTHYLVSGNTLLDSEDIEGLIGSLTEHGYGRRSGTRIVILASQAVIDTVSGFRRNVANNNSKTAKFDWIPAPSQPAMFLPNADGLLGTQPPDTWNGLQVAGSYGDAWFIEEATIPSGYVLAVATGGNISANNLVGIRQHATPEFRGLRLLPGNWSAYPLIESQYQFGMGTGIRQRGGATVMQIKSGANADYEVPADFAHDTLT